jgi:carboxymethylenebutenolidase
MSPHLRTAWAPRALTFAAIPLIGLLLTGMAHAQGRLPARVTFPSADGHTTLVGYLYTPSGASTSRVPAVVLMHGRAGPYSSLAKGRYEAATLSQRHQMWGRFWASLGYVAVLVDSFGPRGYPAGFPRFSYENRPAELDEVTVRPLDAYGALAWLRKRTNVAGDHIGLQGWSNGGSATLATMAAGDFPPASMKGFNAALAFYPACGLKDKFEQDGYRSYASVRVLMGTADEEVSFRRCRALVERSRTLGSDIDIIPYKGASHDFDDPGRRRQSVAANAAAKPDAMARAAAFFKEKLGN